MDPFTIDGRALRAKGEFIADSLYKHCILPGDGRRLKQTASISPGTSLKHRQARDCFAWANRVGENKKFFTLAACREGVRLLLEKPMVEVPFSGMSRDMWIQSQAKVIMHLCQRSRINCGSSFRFMRYQQSKIMDWEDTLPLQAGPALNI